MKVAVAGRNQLRGYQHFGCAVQILIPLTGESGCRPIWIHHNRPLCHVLQDELVSWIPMRRAIAISLMMLFSWTLIAPISVPDNQASLPACCRKNGKHHCAMRIMGLLAGSQSGFTTVAEKCPCYPLNAGSTNSPQYQVKPAGTFYAEFVSYPALALQSEALYCISSLRSHQKRGPPLA